VRFRALMLLFLGAVSAAAVQAAPLPLKNGSRPEFVLPQTRARPLLMRERLYLGMQETAFLGYVRSQGWELIEQHGGERRRGLAASDLYTPGGEQLTAETGEQIFVQGIFVRPFFEHNRLVGLQLTPNFGEGGLTLRQLLILARAWFPDYRLPLRYQVLPEDSAQQVIEALLGRVPDAFAHLVGRTPLQFQSLVLKP